MNRKKIMSSAVGAPAREPCLVYSDGVAVAAAEEMLLQYCSDAVWLRYCMQCNRSACLTAENKMLRNIAQGESPATAISYAAAVLKHRWPQLERILLAVHVKWGMDYHAIDYASKVIGGRWEELEKKLVRVGRPRRIREYAMNVLQGEWVAAEKRLLQFSDQEVLRYATCVKRTRWQEYEVRLLRKARSQDREDAREWCAHAWCVEYAAKVIKGRWPEAEAVLLARGPEPYLAAEYAAGVIGGRWQEYESKLLADGLADGHCYAAKLKCRWAELEEWLVGNFTATASRCLYEYAKNVMGGKLPETLHNRMVMIGLESPEDEYYKVYSGAKKYRRERKLPVIVTARSG